MRTPARTSAWLSALALVTAAGCASRPRGGGPPAPELILPAFRAPAPAAAPVAPTTLTGFTDHEVYGHLSPSGEMLAYSVDAYDDFDIWMRSLRTGERTQISSHPAMDTMPIWSPDGESIVFVSMRDDVKGDLFLWKGDLDEERESSEQLTGRKLGELFPVFSPDGRFVYFAQGPEGQYRIARLDLSKVEDKKDRDDPVAETVVTEWGYSHPAVSPDGSLLAVTRFKAGEPAQVAVIHIDDPKGTPKYGKPRIVTAGPYSKGFPTFSPDGKTLYFMVFHHGAPAQTVTGDAEGSIWSMPSGGLTTAAPAELMAQARQLTPDRAVSVMSQAHESGLVYSGLRGNNFDVFLMPAEGLLPRASTVAAQIALADSYEDTYGKAFALKGLSAFPPTPESQRGLYEALELYADAGEFEKAAEIGEILAAQSGGGPLTDVGRCRAASAYAEATKAREAESGVIFEEADARAALERVQAAGEAARSPEGKAQCRVQAGEVHLLAGDWQAAAAAFRGVLAERDATPAQAAAAYLGQGRVLARMPGGGESGAEYFLGTWDRWPGEARAHLRATREALRVVAAASPDPALEIETLRFLIDRHARKSAFAAKAQYRMGELYALSGQNALAAQAMETLLDRWPNAQPEATRAGFKAGQFAASLAAELRAQGRFNEASAYYDRALASYAAVMKAHPPLNPLHKEARSHTVALSLQRAFQAEQDGDTEKAHGLYTRLLEFEPDAVAALRKVIQHDLNLGVPPPPNDGMDAAAVKARREEIQDKLESNWKTMREDFEARLEEDEGDFGAMYGLGYLWTYDPDLRLKSLDEAEEYLEAAADLRPESPFPHMTLGWVNLMREQYFDKVKDAFVIQALDQYMIADGLNDRGIDLQTEADLLVSHGNAWAALGNGWTYAYEKYQAREALVALGAGFTNPEQKAMFYFNFAQAAYMTDHFREAEDHYETARAIVHARAAVVDPILADGYREMDAQIIAHLALVNHFMGDYEASNRYFDQTIKLYTTRRKTHLLSALTRSVAYNLILMGEYTEAITKLEEARVLYSQHGGMKNEESTRIALTPEGSLFFGGFAGDAERHVQTALADLIYRDNHALWYASQQAARQLEQREDLYKENENPDFARAMWILEGRVAASALKAGDRATFAKELDGIFDDAVELQWDDTQAEGEEFQGRPELFVFMVTAMVNRAEQMLAELAVGRRLEPDELPTLAKRLRKMEDWRQRIEVANGGNLIADEELRLKYLNATALLFLNYGRSLAADAGPAAKGGDTKKKTGWGTYSLSGKFDAWMLQASFFSDAAGLLLQAVARTAPEPGPSARPAPDLGRTFVVDRLRWHVESLMNLAEVASYFTAPDALTTDRGMAYLEQARRICNVQEALARNEERAAAAAAAAQAQPEPEPEADPDAPEAPPAPPTAALGDVEETPIPVVLDLGEACPLLDMEFASRKNDLDAARAAVNALPPAGFLGERYRTHGATVRHRMFGRAREVALRVGDMRAVLDFAEDEDRRMVADELAAFGYISPSGPLQAALDPIRQWHQFYQRAWANQTIETKGREAHEAALAAMARARNEGLWRDLFAAVDRQSSAVADLIFGTRVADQGLAEALGDKASVVSAVVVGQEVVFFNLRRDGDRLAVKHALAKGRLPAIREAAFYGEQNLPALLALLPDVVGKWVAGDKTVYFDLLRLGTEFPVDAVAARWAPNALPVHLAGVLELGDAFRARNLYVTDGLVLSSDAVDGNALPRADIERTVAGLEGWRVLEEEKLSLTRTAGHMIQSGMQLWTLPLRVEEDSLANVRLGLKGEVRGLEDYRFPLRLGDRLKTSFVAAVGASDGLRGRDGLVMTTRYLHALGVPTIALAPRGNLTSEALTKWFGELARRLGKESAGDAFHRVPVPAAPVPLRKGETDEDPEGRDIERFDRVRLYGSPGLSPSDAGVAGLEAERMFTAGKAAWDVAQYRVTATNLEPALALWRAAGDTESAKVIEAQEILARAHFNLGDTRSAVITQLSTVEKLEKTSQPKTRVYDAWLRVPEWQTAGGRGADAIESVAAIKARLDKDLPAAQGAEAAALTGFSAAAWGVEAMALESLRKYPEAMQGYEKAAELAKKSLSTGGDAAAQSRRIAEFSALGARVARLHLSDSARAKRGLTLALGAMPKVDRAEYTGLEATYAEYVKRLADAPGDEEVALYSKGVHDYTVQLTEKRQDVHAAAVVLRELAYVKLSRADAAGAAVDAEQALALSTPLADQSLAHSCRIALSMARLELGDAADALALADTGLKVSHLLPQWHARFHAARGRALTHLGRLDEARTALTEGVRLSRESRDDEGYADALRDLGRLELEAGNPGKAATQFRSAEVEDREKGDPVRIADDLVNAGKVLRVMGRYDDARARLKEARELAKPADAWEVLVRVGLETGRVLAAENDHEGALAAFRAGLDAEQHLSLPGVRWMLQLGEATALAALKRDAEAEKALLEAASAVELLPARPRRAPGAEHIDFEFKDVYDQLVKLYAAQNRAADAFDAAERWRSRGFVDMTARSAGVFKRGRDAVARYTEKLSALREAEAEAGEAAPDDRARARKAADTARTAADEARRALAAVDAQLPAYFAVDIEPFAALQKRIPAQTTLLTYYTAPWGAVAFVADAQGLSLHALKTDAAALTTEIRNYRRHTAAFDALEVDSKRLFDALLGPVQDKLAARVLVVPEGPLNVLPFAGLWTGKGWAVERWNIAYLPSANHLRTLTALGAQSPRAPMAFNWAGMGPDTEPKAGTKKYFRRLEEWRGLRTQWPHLPFTEKETAAFKDSFPAATVFAGREATREAFLEKAGKADLLEIAAHAVYVPENPMLSYLQFGGVPAGDLFPAFAEQRVTLYDVLGLDLNAAVATLSACETGLADPEGGDGLAGMHRAFLTAGAKSVVSSLWRVSDLTSGVLMKNFHRNLKAHDPATALRDAQLKVMKYFPHPAYWAGFRLDGVGR